MGQILRFLAFEPPGAESPILPLGQPADFPLDQLSYVAEAKLYVGRDQEGLYAIDAVCTHLGCLVELEESGRFLCPCHGSFFDLHGRVQTGPASNPLRHLVLYLGDDGLMMVDRDRPVEMTTRLNV
jgi:Rieske Fe-S protein